MSLKDYKSISISVVGVALGTFFSIKSAITPPSGGGYSYYVFAIIVISIAAGVAVNYPAIFKIKKVSANKDNVLKKYAELRGKIAPILMEGIDEVLKREKKTICDKYNIHEDKMEIHVFFKCNSHYYVVASTTEKNSLQRALYLKDEEGVVGFTKSREAPIVCHINQDHTGVVYNSYKEDLGTPRSLEQGNVEKLDTRLAWIYSLPVYTHHRPEPWKKEIISILAVDLLCDYVIHEVPFFHKDFASSITDVSEKIASYVEALEGLDYKLVEHS